MKNIPIKIEDKLGNIPFFIDRFHEKIKKTDPHIHEDYYELIYLSEGEGFHCIETEEFLISASEFYFLRPGQLHCWQFTSIPKGFIIMFKTSYFNQVSDNNILNQCRLLSNTFRIDIPKEYCPEPLFNAILQEFLSANEFSVNIIHAILAAIIAKMLQLAEMPANEKLIPRTLFHKFLDLVFKESARLHLVNDYAKLLSTTTQNINAACHKHSNKTANELISAQLMLESKRYLIHTDCSMSEIAYHLSFSDASYFGKFFKLHEGITPLQFRAKYIQ